MYLKSTAYSLDTYRHWAFFLYKLVSYITYLRDINIDMSSFITMPTVMYISKGKINLPQVFHALQFHYTPF